VYCVKGTEFSEEPAAATCRYKISNVDQKEPKGVGC
jgi:hypothetical protein